MSSDKYFKELQSLKYFDEEKLIEKIINESDWLNDEEISINAESIVEKCRGDRNKTKLDNFFLEYGLSNQEGVALMCLAESLLRIPDNSTCDEIIEEKINFYNLLFRIDRFMSYPLEFQISQIRRKFFDFF